MTEMLEYPFMQSALVMGAVLGAMFSLMGIFVVTRGMSFFSDFIAHAAILGSALGVVLHIEPGIFLVVFSVIIGLSVSAVWNRFPLSRDTVLGAFYGGAVAAGVILISVKGLGQAALMQFLFGDILLIKASDMVFSAGLLAAFIIFLSLNERKLVKSSFMPEIAMAEGINVRLYDYALIGLIALAVALSIKVVGVMLANAMIVIPAASAKTLSRSFKGFKLLAPVFGVISFSAGITASFYLDIPSGPSIAGAAFLLFLFALALKALSVFPQAGKD